MERRKKNGRLAYSLVNHQDQMSLPKGFTCKSNLTLSFVRSLFRHISGNKMFHELLRQKPSTGNLLLQNALQRAMLFLRSVRLYDAFQRTWYDAKTRGFLCDFRQRILQRRKQHLEQRIHELQPVRKWGIFQW